MKPASYIKTRIKSWLRKIYWMRRNSEEGLWIQNYNLPKTAKIGKKTKIREFTEIGDISLGDYSYISGPRTYIEDAVIGKYCSIARDVVIGVSGHNYEWVTTHPIIVSNIYGMIDKSIATPQKPTPVIGNDVWIGMNVIIMRGVTIGDGAVVAAGSIVTTDVKPYSIVAGIPSKHIKYRFNPDTIDELMAIQWWDWSEEKIKENISLFYDIEKFIKIHSVRKVNSQ